MPWFSSRLDVESVAVEAGIDIQAGNSRQRHLRPHQSTSGSLSIQAWTMSRRLAIFRAAATPERLPALQHAARDAFVDDAAADDDLLLGGEEFFLERRTLVISQPMRMRECRRPWTADETLIARGLSEAAEGRRFAIGEIAVGLVDQQMAAASLGERDQGIEFNPAHHRAGRVVRAGDADQPGVRLDRRLDACDIDGEA